MNKSKKNDPIYFEVRISFTCSGDMNRISYTVLVLALDANGALDKAVEHAKQTFNDKESRSEIFNIKSQVLKTSIIAVI